MAAVVLSTLAALFFIALELVQPSSQPSALVDDSRLANHVQNIASRPHPMGGEANRQAQRYIVNYLQSLGLQVEVQRETVVYQHPRRRSSSTRIGTVENIVASLPGTEGKKTIALMSHYDSVPGAPGAGDAAAGVAAVLEAATRLTQPPLPGNNVRFVITDGEERGLFGAQAYFNDEANAAAIDLVLNFEARGTSGPSMMFETSDGNSWLVRTLNEAVPDLVATSLSYEIYRRMPNDTDATIAKAADVPILNFAFIGDPFDYHTSADNPDNLDPDTLRQHATNAVGAAVRFANEAEWPTQAADDTYFSLVPGVLVQYGQTVELLFAIAVLVLTLAAILKTHRGVDRPVRKTAFGLLALVLYIVLVSNLFETWIDYRYLSERAVTGLSALGVRPFLWYVCITVGVGFWMFRGLATGMSTVGALAPFALILLACIPAQRLNPMLVGAMVPAALGLWWVRDKVGPAGVLSAALLLWLVTGGLLFWYVPKAAYVALWPLGAMAGSILLAGAAGPENSWRHAAALLPGAALVLLIMVPTVYLFYLSLGIAMPQLPMMLMALVVIALMPLILIVSDFHGDRTGLLLMAVGVGALFVTAATDWRSSRHPYPEEIFLAVDAGSQQSYWATGDNNLSSWQKSVLGEQPDRTGLSEIIPNARGQLWVGTPSSLPFITPAMTLSDDQLVNNGRKLTFSLAPRPGAEHLSIFFPDGVRYLSAAANGLPVPVPDPEVDSDWRWRWDGLGTGRATVEVEVNEGQAMDIVIVEVRYNMPETPTPRPADSQPSPYSWSNATVTYRTLKVPAQVD